jgi:hypothetical protein
MRIYTFVYILSIRLHVYVSLFNFIGCTKDHVSVSGNGSIGSR